MSPPLVEVVCEFRFSPDTQWDMTVPGLLYEKLKNEFPVKESRIRQEVEIRQEPEGIKHEIRSVETIVLFAKDMKTLVQIGKHLITINRLKPYIGWDKFFPKIEKVWRVINEIIELKRMNRLGLRYINQITIPLANPKLEDYFELYPFLGEKLPKNVTSFLLGVEFNFDGNSKCRVQLTPIAIHPSENKDDTTQFLLDIDYFYADQNINPQITLEWVENAHDRMSLFKKFLHIEGKGL